MGDVLLLHNVINEKVVNHLEIVAVFDELDLLILSIFCFTVKYPFLLLIKKCIAKVTIDLSLTLLTGNN